METFESASTVALVNQILATAILQQVSHIHLEPQADGLRVRFRHHGVLKDAMEILPQEHIPAITARIKVIANLDIAERRKHQYGKIQRMVQGRKIDGLTSTLPSRFGERIVIELREAQLSRVQLEDLILDERSYASLKGLLNHRRGLILVTSPPRGGQTTTLYALVEHCNHTELNICTLEDSIERDLPGLTQIQVLNEPHMDYASGLNSLLRQDADVIMVTDIPDQATAIAALAASRDTLVIAGLCTTSSEQAIIELQRIGLEPWQIARSLLGVVHQRLLRRVCPDCRVPYHPTRQEWDQFGELATIHGGIVYQAQPSFPPEKRIGTQSNAPCPSCGGGGYRGVMAVCEVLTMTEKIQTLLFQGSSMDELRHSARAEGMKTVLDSSLEQLRQGETTLEEVEQCLTD